MLRTKDEVLKSIKEDGRNLRFASIEFRDDDELVRMAIKNGADLSYASFRLQNDDSMCDFFSQNSSFEYIFERALFFVKKDLSTFYSRCGLFKNNKEFILCTKLYHGSSFDSPIIKYNSYSEEQIKNELFNLRIAQTKKFFNLSKKPFNYSDLSKIESSEDLMYSLMRIPSISVWYHQEPFSKVIESFEKMVDSFENEQDYYCSTKGIGSFPERVTKALLNQLNIKYDYEKVFLWSEGDPTHSYKGRKRYDFYIPSTNTIIEVHGAQHYNKGFEALGGRTLQEEQKNDKQKYDLAVKNGISNYIIIDAHSSKLDYLYDSFTNNKEFNDLFNISKLDWKQIRQDALGVEKYALPFPYQEFRINFYNDWIEVLKNFNETIS